MDGQEKNLTKEINELRTKLQERKEDDPAGYSVATEGAIDWLKASFWILNNAKALKSTEYDDYVWLAKMRKRLKELLLKTKDARAAKIFFDLLGTIDKVTQGDLIVTTTEARRQGHTDLYGFVDYEHENKKKAKSKLISDLTKGDDYYNNEFLNKYFDNYLDDGEVILELELLKWDGKQNTT